MKDQAQPELEQAQARIWGDGALRTVVYLPGLHGNWRLIAGFRKALRGRVRLVELSYPPTLSWTLEDYAAGIERALAALEIHRGWLLAESFGSAVAWPLLARGRFEAEGLILAGGFVRHPLSFQVRLAERLCGRISFAALVRILFGYAKLARFRFRHSPETMASIKDFIAHLTKADLEAAKHRLHLIGQSDPCTVAEALKIPVFALTGLFDPVVPWWWVRRWLKRHCPALRQYRIIWRADHNVLGTAPTAAADQVVAWVGN